MNEIALMEAASSVYKRKYQCPYCNDKYDRVKLVDHIEKKHAEFIPKDFTASRIVFNIVNKKEKGKCTICGKESPWDEDKCRYDRFCSDKCKKAYEQLAAERLKRVRGMTKQEMLKDPEYQNNVMLANRSISGKYKFQDGAIRTYVASYEHKFLEFMDKFLNVKSEDLETPGPIIEYKFKGETHKWITDEYYVPYNLVFDIKDGGDNPNKREMPEYRAKQIAKEDAIRKQGKYNYIRLTDNKFEQLIELMLELKELYIENNGEYNPIIRINESTVLESKKAKDLGPKVCSKCGSKNIGVFFQGEPIYKCKDCGKYLGTVPFNESTSNDIIQNAFNSVIHTIKWCRMDSFAFCNIKEYSEPKIINDNSFSAGKFACESGIDAVVKTINDNNIFENGKYSASCNNNELIITIDKLNNMNESYIIDKIYKGDNNMIHENKSTLDPNHKTKKTDTTFKFIDLKDPSVDKYLKQDKYCTEYWDYIHKSCIGEIVIDADSDCIAGYVFLDNKKYPGFITPVVVIKKYRGYGLSSKLVKDAINKYKAIDLTVTKDNEVAIKLYKDNGFVIIGDGNSKNEYWMKLKSKLTDEEKSKVVNESSNKSILDELLSLNMKLNLFEYGLPMNGQITDVKSSKYWDENYKTMSISEFEQYKGGICWDYIFYQDYMLKRLGIQHTNYYIISSNYQTHTITVAKDSGKLYYIESSFKRICGVYPADNINDILFFVIKKMGIPDYYVFKINSFPKTHSTSNEYMQFMEDKGTLIMKGKSNSIKDTKLENIQRSFKFPKDERNIKEYCVLHDKGYFKLLDKYKDPKDCSWDEEQTYPTIAACIRAEKCFGKDRYCYIMDMDTYSIHYIGKMHISNFEDDGYSVDWLEITDDYPFPRDDINEACKNTEEARKFVTDVRKIAKKYDANFFVVTDGASGYHNGPNSNPAVKNARDQQIEWEKKNGFDPDEDWSKSIKEFSIITPSSDKPSQEGFIGHGSWNAIKKVNGEPYRERVEVIIFNKELDKVLIGTKKSDGSVKLPGGGTDKNSSLESQATKECQEEVKVNIDNLKYIGSYSMPNKQAGYKDDVYKGQYTYLYLAIYDSDYTGYIRPEDLDSLYDTAEWMSIYDAKKLLKKRSVDLYNLFNYNYKLYINDLSYLKL